MRNTKLKSIKGITLIALVITIIVLLILAGVAISMLSGENGILNQAATAKTETEKKSVEEQVKLAVMSALTAGEGKVDLGILNSELTKVKGETVNIGELPYDVEIGEETYTISKNGLVTDNSNVAKEYTAYSIGDEVTIGTETFYVIKDSETTEKMVTLLAKKNINTTSLKQEDGASPEAFSNNNYWQSNEEKEEASTVSSAEANKAWIEKWGYPKDLNSQEYDSVRGNDAIAKARQYAEKTIGNGAIGRLMTKAEANTLNTETYLNILYGQYEDSSNTGLNYYLSSVDGDALRC